MLPCEVTSPQQPAGMGPPQTLPTGKRGLWAAAGVGMGLGWDWNEVGTGTTLLNEGLMRVLHWHNSSGWDLPWRADAHPSPGWNSSWSQACPNLSKAAPACCGMSTKSRVGLVDGPRGSQEFPQCLPKKWPLPTGSLPLERLGGNGHLP